MELLNIIKSAPKLEKVICYDIPVGLEPVPTVFTVEPVISAYQFMNLTLLPALQKYKLEADDYCAERDSSDEAYLFTMIKTVVELELNTLFADYPDVTVALMSSFGANLHLQGNKSDIDFGILVKDLSEDKVKIYGEMLEKSLKYVFGKKIHGYYSYEKTIFNVDVEVKIRDADESVDVVKLHAHLDMLSRSTQNLLAYAKSLVVDNDEIYCNLKKIIYSSYNTEINMFKF